MACLNVIALESDITIGYLETLRLISVTAEDQVNQVHPTLSTPKRSLWTRHAHLHAILRSKLLQGGLSLSKSSRPVKRPDQATRQKHTSLPHTLEPQALIKNQISETATCQDPRELGMKA